MSALGRAENLAHRNLNPVLFDQVISEDGLGDRYGRLSSLGRLNEDGLYAEQAPATPGMGQH